MTFSRLTFHVSYLFVLILFIACSTSRLPLTNYQEQVSYTVIYLIHADANYLYHNRQGEPLQADLKVLNEAKQIGRKAEDGEVFIFHLKPETNIFYVFPKKDRRFLYYRNGELVYEKSYSPSSKKQPFVTEAKLYKYFHQTAETDSAYKKVLLYFGHEIPVQKGTHYFRSRPDAALSTALFAEGIGRFLQPENKPFDLTVLSTCDNGTPLMAQMLAPFTDFLLASPQNLHLSHIDTKALLRMENPGEIETKKLASAIASETYNRLSSFLQTVITLSLYDLNEIKVYLPIMATFYKGYLNGHEDLRPMAENIDCGQLSFFTRKQPEKGVKVWYKPPQFGQKAGDENFSGWGCKQQ